MRDSHRKFLRQRGFSLIELMVGLVLGLLATLVIVNVFSNFEGQKRTTSGNADAQTNGAIALMNIQRNIQMAGYGLPLPMADLENSSLKCAAFANYDPPVHSVTGEDPPPTNIFPLVIEDGIGGNGSDVITVRYSTTAMGAVPVRIINASGATGAGINVDNNIGCNDNDIALIMNGNACIMATIADGNGNPDTDVNITLHATTPAGAPLVNNAKIACMGNWQNYSFQLVNDELQLNGQPIVSEVVNLQAQYGVAATADSNQVNQWVNATGAWAAPTVEERNRIKAIRVAVILRNSLLEKEAVTTACSSTTDPNPTGLCAWDATSAGPTVASPAPVINLNAIGGPNYRYRVFETIIPLRNMLWSREAV
jgi:type IV pilus assembly protein PilW